MEKYSWGNIVNLLLFLLFFEFFAVPFYFNAWGQEELEKIELIKCTDETLGFQIPCGRNWPVTIKKLSVSFEISDKDGDRVSVTLSKWKEPGLNFEDLTPAALQRVFDYVDYFKYEKLWIHSRRTIRIEAKPTNDSEQVIVDYFFLNDNQLYRISFSVDPHNQLEKYQFLFETMVDNFKFLD